MNALRVGVAIVATLAGLSACGAEPPVATAPASTAPGVTEGTEAPADVPDLSDACSLLTGQELGTVFADGVPAGDGTSYGAGFAECIWEDNANRIVRLSVMPPASLQSDYLDQLNASGEVAALGEGSVTFTGVVGIGTVERGGVTGAFTVGDIGVLLAVRTGDGTDETADLIHVTVLGQRLRSRVG